ALENDGSMESNCALSNPSDTKTLATSSAEPPMTGSLWQPKQEFESGPLVRLNGGLTPFLRLVGMIACVAFGRPAPSTVVNFALNSARPRSMRAGRADGPAAAIASKSRCEPGGKTRTSQLAASTFPARASPSVAARLKPHETSGAPSSFGALTVSAGLTIVPPAEIVRPSAGGRALSPVAAPSVDRTGGNKRN